MSLLPEDVQEILSLLDTLPFDEFDVETGSLRVSLRRTHGGGWTQETEVLASPDVVPVQGDVDAPEAPVTPPRDAPAVREGLTAVRAPLPGTFYRAPKPGAPPYVEVGSRVEEDTVVGLVETMKLFNSVHANVAGTVAEFLIDDAAFAQQDAHLLLIEPDEA